MPNAIAFPRISREVLMEPRGEQLVDDGERFRKEQPHVVEFALRMSGSFDEAAVMLNAMETLYSALQRQMRRGA